MVTAAAGEPRPRPGQQTGARAPPPQGTHKTSKQPRKQPGPSTSDKDETVQDHHFAAATAIPRSRRPQPRRATLRGRAHRWETALDPGRKAQSHRN